MRYQDTVIQADVISGLARIPEAMFQVIIADPPYGNVLLNQAWDKRDDVETYLNWTESWFKAALPKLKPDGLIYFFGQLGKREHRWIELNARLCRLATFHDQIIWDRAVGYNDRKDSFTPAYEICLVLRKTTDAQPFFNKDANRIPYDEPTIDRYLKDKRYKDMEARRLHLQKGKYATNILRVPSLRGSSKEKVGHPSQKPERLIEMLVASSSKMGDWVLDPFFGSGTTGVVCEKLGRRWVGIEKDARYCKLARERIARTRKPNNPVVPG